MAKRDQRRQAGATAPGPEADGAGSATNVTAGQTDGHSGTQTGNDDGLQSGNQRAADLGTQPGSRTGASRKPGPSRL